MMPILFLHNWLFWAAQVSVVALVGAVLAAIFRIHHPRWHLAYCYSLLLACAVLPMIQPWQHPVASGVTASPALNVSETMDTIQTVDAGSRWRDVLVWTLLAGTAARLCWFLAGLWQISRYRRRAEPLAFFPEPVRLARSLTGSGAAISISGHNIGPVAFGLCRPIVLLPASFLTLDRDAQRAVICHELLHVKRKDWLVTAIEELLGACLWFHPAIWWLLSQTRLAREQIVDAEVIRLTAAPDAYINALLSMADICPVRALMPVPTFFSKRHLVRRLRAMLIDSPVSRLRLTSSYASMAAVMVVTGYLAFASFPLTGLPRILEPAAPQPARWAISEGSRSMERVFRVGEGVTPPKLIVHADPQYPERARQALTQGTVVVQAIVQTDGTLTVVRVLQSVNPELDRNAVLAMQQWRFEPGTWRGMPVPVEIDVEASFKLQR